jgi:hypothetical protein
MDISQAQLSVISFNPIRGSLFRLGACEADPNRIQVTDCLHYFSARNRFKVNSHDFLLGLFCPQLLFHDISQLVVTLIDSFFSHFDNACP